jgi:hypothetical protein
MGGGKKKRKKRKGKKKDRNQYFDSIKNLKASQSNFPAQLKFIDFIYFHT